MWYINDVHTFAFLPLRNTLNFASILQHFIQEVKFNSFLGGDNHDDNKINQFFLIYEPMFNRNITAAKTGNRIWRDSLMINGIDYSSCRARFDS